MFSWNVTQVHMRLYQDDTMMTLEMRDNGKGIACERTTTPHVFRLQGRQERVSLRSGHFHIVGIPGIGTTAIASVPARRPKALANGLVVECFAP